LCVLIFDDYINIKHTQGKTELFITERERESERMKKKPEKERERVKERE